MKTLQYQIQLASYNNKIIKKPMQKFYSKIQRSKVPVVTVNNMSKKKVTSEKQGKGDQGFIFTVMPGDQLKR